MLIYLDKDTAEHLKFVIEFWKRMIPPEDKSLDDVIKRINEGLKDY